MTELGVALIGAGAMGRFHAATLANLGGVRVRVVVDPDARAAQGVAREAPGARAAPAPEDALADDVDALVIASPAATHAEVIALAAAAGKAVFCEKPLATTLADAERAAAALARHDVPFQLGFQRRFDSGIMRLRRLVTDGELGRVETVRSITCDPEGPDLDGMRQAAGIFHDTLSHDADLALTLGGPVRAVFARGSAMTDARFEALGKPDTTIISLAFDGGALGVIENRLRTGYGYETVLEVGCAGGKAVVRDDAVDALTLYRDGRIERAHVPWYLERFAQAYRAEVAAFITCLRADRRPTPGASDGLAAMRLCAAAERSYREGREVLVHATD